MGRRLSAVICAAVLAFAAAGCGGDSDDEPTTENTSQSDPTSDDDTTEPTDEPDDPTSEDDDHKGKGHGDKNGKNDDKNDDVEDDGDDNGAIPDDLESNEPDDPDGLPIDAQVVLDTCEGVEPKDTWPGIDEIAFDGGAQNVVATADVEMKGGQTLTVVCDISGSDSNPQVRAYSPI